MAGAAEPATAARGGFCSGPFLVVSRRTRSEEATLRRCPATATPSVDVDLADVTLGHIQLLFVALIC